MDKKPLRPSVVWRLTGAEKIKKTFLKKLNLIAVIFFTIFQVFVSFHSFGYLEKTFLNHFRPKIFNTHTILHIYHTKIFVITHKLSCVLHFFLRKMSICVLQSDVCSCAGRCLYVSVGASGAGIFPARLAAPSTGRSVLLRYGTEPVILCISIIFYRYITLEICKNIKAFKRLVLRIKFPIKIIVKIYILTWLFV